MSEFDTTEKLDVLIKESFGVTSTDETLAWYSEDKVPYNNYLFAEDIFLNDIPDSPIFDTPKQASDIGLSSSSDFYSYTYNTGDVDSCSIVDDSSGNIRRFQKLKLDYVPGTNKNGRSWYKLDSDSNYILRNSLQFNVKQSGATKPYDIKIYESSTNPPQQIFPTTGSWSYNVKNGILYFADFNEQSVVTTTKPPLIDVCVYVGQKGLGNFSGGGGGGSGGFISGNVQVDGILNVSENIVAPEGNFDSLYQFDQNGLTNEITLGLNSISAAGSGGGGGGGGSLPLKTIVIWSGTIDNIPDGWALCNGDNTTPDLRSKFVIGYDDTDPSYNMGENGPSTNIDGFVATDGPHYINIPYYTLAYIMKVGTGIVSDVSNGLFLNGDVSFNGELFLDGHASFNGGLSLNGDASFNAGLSLDGDASFNAGLSLDGDASFNSGLIVAGAVGIGTDNPGSKLHVKGGAICIERTFGDSGDLQPGLVFLEDNSGDDSMYIAYDAGGTGATSNEGLGFYSTSGGGANPTSGTQIMMMRADGKVGIGTDSPARQLTIHAANYPTFQLTNSSTGTNAGNGFEIEQGGNSTSIINRATGNMTFHTANAERMRINATGYVGIGTTGPAHPLHITSSGGSYQYEDLYAYHHAQDQWRYNSGNRWTGFGAIGYEIGLRVNEGIMCQRQYFNSDERIKKDIVDLVDDEALLKFRQLKPKTYSYRDTNRFGDQPVYGFIAQEVAAIIPNSHTLISEYIPSIMTQGKVSLIDASSCVLTIAAEHELVVNDIISCSDANNNKIDDISVIEIIDSNTIKINKVLTEEETTFKDETGYNETDIIFVYGKKVDDFHSLNKDSIWTVATAALQEVDRQQQADKARIATLETQVATLETENATMETQLADLIARVSALETA